MSKHNVSAWIGDFEIKNRLWKIEPSFFELTVIMAFDYFAKQQVDVAVIEVGLGGRLDSTNIISPEVSVITNIGYDHVNLLGNTLGKIAIEKAGIIKSNVPVVIGTSQLETKPVFLEKAKRTGSEIFFADDDYQIEYGLLGIDGKQILNVRQTNILKYNSLKIDLLGAYQQKNIPAVLSAINVLKNMGWNISENSVYGGLESVIPQTGLHGRWQVIGNNPLVVCDTGHNEDGIAAVVQQINNTPFDNLHVIFGTVADKEPDNILKLLPQNAIYYFVKANIPRAMNEHTLAQKAEFFGLRGKTYRSVKTALRNAKQVAGRNDMIFVGGSTYVVAEIL